MKRGLVLVLLWATAWAGLAQTFVVSRIEVIGNVHVSTREVLNAVAIKPGAETTREQVLLARDAILELGYFSEVTPDLGFEGEAIVLRFKVVEYPKILHVAVEGVPPTPQGRRTLWSWIQAAFAAPPVTEQRVRDILAEHGVKPGQVLNRKKLEEGIKAVLEEYKKRDVATVQLGRVVPGDTLVVEFQELKVVGHRFQGLVTIPEEEARKLVTVPVGAVGKMSDIQASAASLGSSVFFSQVNLGAELDQGGVVLVWQLKERTVLPVPTSLQGIQLGGVKSFPAEKIQARVGPLPPRQVTNLDVLRALAPAYDYYRREGFFLVEFVAEGVAGGVLQVRVKEGELTRVEVDPGTKTASWVIERVMAVSPGQVLTEARFSAARQALMGLGYFSDVQLEPRWVGDDVVLKVTVQDLEKLGSLKGSVSISPTTGGLVGNLEYAQKNVWGTAQDLALTFSTGIIQTGSTTWNLSYTGRAFPVYDQVGLDLYRTESGEGTRTLTLGGKVSLSYPVGPYLDLSLSVTHEQAWELLGDKELQPRTALEVGLVWDDRDSPLFTRRGQRSRVSVERAGWFAPGVDYLAIRGEATRFWPMDLTLGGSDWRMALAARVVSQWGWNMPERYQFDLGGSASVRGAKPLRTQRLALVNTELRLEVAQGAWISLFGDLGGELAGGGAVKGSVGVELAAYILGMFVRLDLCWPTDREPTWVPAFEFGMSPMF